MPISTDALFTFTPQGGSATELGNDDCFVTIINDRGQERYEVKCRYVSLVDVIDGQTPAGSRADAEVYFKDLVDSLGGVINPISVTHDSRPTVFYPKHAVPGTLDNPYTSLSVTGLYLIGASFQDEGWRGYEFTLTFGKQAAALPSDNVPTFNGTAIGTRNGWVQANYDQNTGTKIYVVTAFYTAADRATAEVYAQNLADTFKVRALKNKDNLLLPAFDGAVKGTFTNPATGLSVDDLYAVNLRHQDDGNNQYALVVTLQSSNVSDDPVNDTLVPKFEIPCGGTSTQIGNIQASLDVQADWDFTRYIIKGSYDGPLKYSYAESLISALGTTHNNLVVLGNAKGRVLTPCSVAGCLKYDGETFDDLYIQDFSSELKEGIVEFEITFVRGNSDP